MTGLCRIAHALGRSPGRQVVVNLISHTTTNKGLKIRAMLDENTYDTGIKVSNADINSIALKKRRFHGDWNYQIKPRKTT